MTTLRQANVNRRAALEMLGAMGAAFVVGCGSTETDGTGGTGGTGTTTTTAGTTTTPGTTTTGGTAECTTIPDETSGPYPDKDGMLNNQAFYRRDVTEGKPGLPLSVTFTVVNVGASCAAVTGAAVEIWHCDKDGVYSEYTGQPGVSADESTTTFMRGLQTTDAHGQVTFTTIYPGWYAGRVTHIHVEVYINGVAVKTTQMAFPDAITAEVYATALYAKGQNTMTNATDMVFSDGDTHQLAALTGDATTGYTATLTLGITA
jgi:protocatechuate 3,4-dioxygenase beta subunit